MRIKRKLLGIVILGLVIGVFGGYGLSHAYTMTIGINDNQGGSLNISYDIVSNDPNSGLINMRASCCFSSYHPDLEGAMIDGCLNMTYYSNYSGTNFTLTVDGGPITYTFVGGGSFQVSYDNFRIDFIGAHFTISGTVYVDGVPYDLSDWGGNPMWLFF